MTSSVAPTPSRVGWIGTGVMGASMCGHLLDAGHEVTVTARTRARADALVARGATWADSPDAVAAGSDVVFSIVGHPADVREVVLGDHGVLRGASAGCVVVDMTTSDPALAVEIAAHAEEQGVAALDAPVSGGDVGARAGTLSIMVGGDAGAFTRVEPLLAHLGTTIVRQGGPGAGQRTKLVNQTLIAANMVGVCEALVYAHRVGLDLATVLTSVASGAAGSWSLTNLAPRMLAGDLAPGFTVDHFVKDLGLVLADARRVGIELPGLALAEELYRGVQAQGGGADGTQALVLAVAARTGTAWPAPVEAT